MHEPALEPLQSSIGVSSATVVRAQDFTLGAGERWYVTQVLHHKERLAGQHLALQGFRYFCPWYRKTVRHARRLRETLAPVFPSYIFVAFDVERDRWRSINGTLGVARLIKTKNRPTPAPNGIVEQLVATLDGAGLVRFDGGLSVGQAVRVVSGPFAGFLGRLERLDGNGRVRVLLEIMGFDAPVVMNKESLSAA